MPLALDNELDDVVEGLTLLFWQAVPGHGDTLVAPNVPYGPGRMGAPVSEFSTNATSESTTEDAFADIDQAAVSSNIGIAARNIIRQPIFPRHKELAW